MKEVTISKYVAYDGKEFETKEKCEEYERNYINSDFKKICGDMNYIYTSSVDVLEYGSDWDGILFIEIKNEEQAERFCKWCDAYGIYVDKKEIVGEYLIVNCYGDGGVDSIESVYDCRKIYDVISIITKNIMRYMFDLKENSIVEEYERNKK